MVPVRMPIVHFSPAIDHGRCRETLPTTEPPTQHCQKGLSLPLNIDTCSHSNGHISVGAASRRFVDETSTYDDDSRISNYDQYRQ